jgi:hypothetical protein
MSCGGEEMGEGGKIIWGAGGAVSKSPYVHRWPHHQ